MCRPYSQPHGLRRVAVLPAAAVLSSASMTSLLFVSVVCISMVCLELTMNKIIQIATMEKKEKKKSFSIAESAAADDLILSI